MYLESLIHNPIMEVVEKHPKIKVKGSDIKFSDRSCIHKIARVIYKILRSLYVGVIFYFVPFSTLMV